MRTMACVVAMALMLGGIPSDCTTAAELPNIVFIYRAFATENDQNPERDIYALYVRTPRWKFILWLQDVRQARNGDYFRIQAIETQYPERDRGSFDLYDLVADPYEQRNLADDPPHAELVARFRHDVLDWWQETGGKPLRPGGQPWP